MPPNKHSLPDLAATKSLAKLIAPHLKKGDVIALEGDLGSGKTEFARALLHILGAKGDVPSPTFTLLQTYEIPLSRTAGEGAERQRREAGEGNAPQKLLLVSHFDLYRLKSENELDELGWDDALADGVTLVEWPEHALGRLPQNRLTLRFTLDQNGKRSCALEKHGSWKNRNF